MRFQVMSSGRRRCAAASLLSAGIALAALGAAAAPGGSVVERLLDILLAQKTITPEQYDELLGQARDEEAAAAARIAQAAKAPEAAPVSTPPPEWTFGWSNGFKLERTDGSAALRFGGRIQADGAVIAESNGLSNDLRTLGGEGQGNGVEFRRARLFFSGTVYERLFFKAQYDFAGGEASFKDVYVGLNGLGPVGELQVGQFKEPFFLDEQTSDDYISFMERGLNNAFFPDRNVGVMATNTAAEKRIQWQLAVFRATDEFGDAFSSFNKTGWDTALRLTGLPLWSEDGSRLVHLGAGYIHRFTGDTVRYRQRPESHLADHFVDTGTLNARGADLFNGELAWVHGPLSFQGEYTQALLNRNEGGSNVGFWGAYAQVSYFLTGEHKVYEPDYGRFGRVKPRANFDPAKGDWGAWEIALRSSYLDLNDSDVRGGVLWDASAGVNWYLFPNARIMLNYVHADLSGRETPAPTFNIGGTGDIVQTRFQVDF